MVDWTSSTREDSTANMMNLEVHVAFGRNKTTDRKDRT